MYTRKSEESTGGGGGKKEKTEKKFTTDEMSGGVRDTEQVERGWRRESKKNISLDGW